MSDPKKMLTDAEVRQIEIEECVLSIRERIAEEGTNKSAWERRLGWLGSPFGLAVVGPIVVAMYTAAYTTVSNAINDRYETQDRIESIEREVAARFDDAIRVAEQRTARIIQIEQPSLFLGDVGDQVFIALQWRVVQAEYQSVYPEFRRSSLSLLRQIQSEGNSEQQTHATMVESDIRRLRERMRKPGATTKVVVRMLEDIRNQIERDRNNK